MTLTSGPIWSLLADPGPISREGARDAAHRELSRGTYHLDKPGLVQRLLERAADWIDGLFGRAAGAVPGGAAGLVTILVLVAGLVVLLLWHVGPLRRPVRHRPLDVAGAAHLGAADHRRAAEEHTAAGRHAEAIRERMRAVARELEARGVLEVRPGRTAEEVAADAGRQLPALAGDLRRAAGIFDEVWYGGRPATGTADAAVRQVDLRVRDAPLRVVTANLPPSDAAVPQ